jgi:hypothetical protein
MLRDGMSWRTDGMTIRIYDHGQQVLSFFLGEAIESAGRELVEQHIDAIESCGWVHGWEPKEKV